MWSGANYNVVDENRRRRWARVLRDIPLPSHLPAFGRSNRLLRPLAVQIDQDRNLWVLEFNVLEPDQRRWTLFDTDGQLLGSIELPDRLDLLQVGPEYVLGLWRDVDDVEYVRLYELVKPERD
jgi:hypothetical protein